MDRSSQIRGGSLSSGTTDHLNETTCLLIKVEDDQKLDKMSSLQNIGGHFMKVLLIVFQVLLCMHLQGTPARAREIPFQIIFSPLLLLQAAGALFSTLQLLESIGIMHLIIEAGSEPYFMISRVYDFLEFILHGSRFLGWWSIDEGQEEEERLHNYRSGIHPDVLEKMSKRDLVEDVWTLQVALRKQIKATKSSKGNYLLLRKDKVICKICKEMEIDVVALPCGHWVLCRFCFKNCPSCPACKASIRSGLIVPNM